MTITEVSIIPVEPHDRLRAYAHVVFDDCFVVRNMSVIAGRERLFVSMPTKKRGDGTFMDLAHPTTPKMREYIETTVLEAFAREGR